MKSLRVNLKILGIVQSVLAVTLCLFVLLTGKLNLQSDLLSLLPQETHSQNSEAETHFFAQYKNNVVISLTGDLALQSHDLLKVKLKALGLEFEILNVPTLEAIAEFYSQYDGKLLSEEYRAQLVANSPLSPFVFEYLSAAINPILDPFFSSQPTLGTGKFVESALSSLPGALKQEGEVLYVEQEQERTFVIVARLPEQASNLLVQQQLVSEILKAIEPLQQQHNIAVSYSGIPFHNVENAAQAQKEMSLFGSLSVFALLLLVWVFFRSLKVIWSASLCLVVAMSYAVITVAAVFGTVHLISFVFAITLVGIAIDYCFHVIIARNESKSAQQQVFKAIWFGCISTLLGYSAFAFMPLVFLQQVAVFVCAGLIGSALTAYSVLPFCVGDLKSTRLLEQCGKNLNKQVTVFRKPVIIVAVTSLLLFLLTQTPIQFTDSLKLLSASSAELNEYEAKHNQLIYGDSHHRILVSAESEQKLLEQEEQIKARLLQNTDAKQISALANWVPSISLQKQNHALLNDYYQTADYELLKSYLNIDEYANHGKYLTLEQALTSPISPFISANLARINTRYVSVVTVIGADAVEIDKQLSTLNFAYRIDKPAQLSEIMQHARENLLTWLVCAIAIFSVILLFKAGLKAALCGGFSMLLCCALALFITAVLQGNINLFNVLALVLIFALAIDYFVFYMQRGLEPLNTMAVTLSAISSALVFGMLIFSQTPAIYSFGLTVMVGILLIYFLSPLMSMRKL